MVRSLIPVRHPCSPQLRNRGQRPQRRRRVTVPESRRSNVVVLLRCSVDVSVWHTAKIDFRQRGRTFRSVRDLNASNSWRRGVRIRVAAAQKWATLLSFKTTNVNWFLLLLRLVVVA